jgi:competence protein ComEA
MKRYRQSILLLVVLGFVMALAASASAVEGEAVDEIPAGGAKVNINTASVEDLTRLDQIGTRTAERIVEYRTANGPFKAPEDLMKVKGIGPKIFEKNRDRISV